MEGGRSEYSGRLQKNHALKLWRVWPLDGRRLYGQGSLRQQIAGSSLATLKTHDHHDGWQGLWTCGRSTGCYGARTAAIKHCPWHAFAVVVGMLMSGVCDSCAAGCSLLEWLDTSLSAGEMILPLVDRQQPST